MTGEIDRNYDVISETILKEQNRLFEFIRKRVPDLEDAEDILQDVFYQFVDKFEGIESIDKVTSWLFTVARNRITDSYRKKKPENFSSKEKRGSEENEDLSFAAIIKDLSRQPDLMYDRAEILDELEDALEDLPEAQREVFVMHEFEDKSFKEIAEITGVSINTALSRKRYAILYLRERLQDLYNDL
ncbi:MAG: sigma-70 family RNA polymerase sigma factor [Bacteroidetes bacterium]|nr:sigma-70 family RNA polymerase sigma factor [Bacteroidota bacterium]